MPERVSVLMPVLNEESSVAEAVTSVLSQEALGERVSYSASLVAAVEQCRRPPREEFTQRCDDVQRQDPDRGDHRHGGQQTLPGQGCGQQHRRPVRAFIAHY